MSLQQLLQGYSQDIAATTQHNSDVENEIRDRKASTLEEQFQNHLDHIQAGMQDLGTASGAWHLGRKVYAKYKERKAKEDANTTDTDAQTQQSNDNNPDRSGEDGDARSGTRADSANQGGTDAAANSDQAGAAAPDRVNTDQQPDTSSDAQTDSSQGQAAQADAQQSQIQNNDAAAQQQAAQSNTGASDGAGNPTPQSADAPSGASSADAGTQNPYSLTSIDPEEYARQTGGSVATTETRAADITPPGQQDLFSSPRTLRTTVSSVEANPSARLQQLSETTGEDVAGIGDRIGAGLGRVQNVIGGVKEAAGNMVKSVGTKVASAAKSVLPESVGDFLGGAGGAATDLALDAIPVVGEVASVIGGLVSLFEGLGHKTDPDAQDSTKAAMGTAQTAIDPTAIVKGAQETTASLV